MSEEHRQPAAFTLEAEIDKPVGGRPAKRRTSSRASISIEPDTPQLPAVLPPAPLPPSRRLKWGTLLFSSLGALIALWAGLAASELIEALFARSSALGWFASGVAGLAGLAALMIAGREIWALARLGTIERLQADAAHALNYDDAASAQRAIAGVKNLYSGRRDTALGLYALASLENEVIDPADRVRLADRELLKSLDLETHKIIARSARRVTMLTTITPAAALDILFVAAQNLKMLREIATLYGGRPSMLSTLRLARMVMGHLAVTGGLALSDSLIQHMIGKGLVGRLSARFGEGTVNGILTSRIGLAAADVCRPIPQSAETKQTLAGLVKELMTFRAGAIGGETASQTSAEIPSQHGEQPKS